MTRDALAGPDGAGTARLLPPRPVPRPLALLGAGLTRLGFRGAFSRDLLLGVFVALVSFVMLYSVVLLARAEGTPFAPTAVAVLVALTAAQSLALCLRRHAPLLCLSAVVATQVGVIALLPADATFQGLAPFLAAYACGTALSTRRLLWALAAAAVVLGLSGFVFALPVLASLAPPALVPGPGVGATVQSMSALLTLGVPGLVGNNVALRRRFAESERLRAVESEKERLEGVVRAERTRMARELHDIAAHHLSGMVVQAGAAEKLAERDAPSLVPTISWVRNQGRRTLENLRMVTGALRDLGEHPRGVRGGADDESPVPGLALLDQVVAEERARGGEVTLERTGGAYDLPPVADAMFYRVAQEALANARDHAWGARVRLELDYREDTVVLRVDNGPGVERERPPEGPRGFGLIGMRERAELIGATLETGPTDAGGWSVRLALPSSSV